jgi:hypothetical protein
VSGNYDTTLTPTTGADAGECVALGALLDIATGVGTMSGAPLTSSTGCPVAQSGCTYTETCQGDGGAVITETVTANSTGTGGTGTLTATSSSTATLPNLSCSWDFTFTKQ